MQHLDGNILCAIDTETTGLTPGKHEIMEIAVVPLDHMLRPHQEILPFHTMIRPLMPENIDHMSLVVTRKDLQEVMLRGIDPFDAADMFERWFVQLGLGFKKNIIPIGHNYLAHDRLFIKEWLGSLAYETFFHPFVRDTLVISQHMNDRADFNNQDIPFKGRARLKDLCSVLSVQVEGFHSALADCVAVAEVYRRMMTMVPTTSELSTQVPSPPQPVLLVDDAAGTYLPVLSPHSASQE